MSACFLSHLDCTFVGGETWRLDSDLVFFSEQLGGKITVPAGFKTDFASVPRVPLAYLLYANRGRKAAVVHDYLYRYKLHDRKTCDAVFKEALAADGEGFFVSWAMFTGVRLFGWKFYGASDGKE